MNFLEIAALVQRKMDQVYLPTLFILILVVSIFLYIKSLAAKTPALPPGPRGLPILGSIPFIGSDILHKFTELASQYGPIFTIRLGYKLCVVISSPSIIKEVVRDQDTIFANRDASVAARIGTYGAKDITWSPYNLEWRKLRKVFVREMLSNKSLDSSYNLRKDEIRKAISRVYSKTGKVVEIGELTFLTEINIVMNMLWGGIVDEKERKRVGAECLVVVSKLVDLFGKPNVSDFFPILARFDLQGVKKQMESVMKRLDDIFDGVIEHRKKLCGKGESEARKDFLQILLDLKENADSNMSITSTQLKALLLDIIVGGTDTTATVVEWAMAELIKNPHIMSKVQNELSDVVGMNNIVEEFHIPKLPYLYAVVKETLRLHPAGPLLVPRCPNQSSSIGGFMVPKNTTVFINVWLMQRDPRIWDNPFDFKPERFLNDSEKWDFSGNNFQYLPFGSGRRICAGLPLAEKMLMYVLASLLHSFDWRLPEGEGLDMAERFGIVLKKSTPMFAIPTPRLSDMKLYK